MVMNSITENAVKAAMIAIASESATVEEKIEMLIEIALGFRKKPQTDEDLQNAVALCKQAEELCGDSYPLLKARALIGRAAALQLIPHIGAEILLQAKTAYAEALPTLQQLASKEEVAEAQMNLGLLLQSLSQLNLVRITDSINAYQQALQVFNWLKYPQEYAIIHNNLAIAYLSMPANSQKDQLRETLALQSFEIALKYINIAQHPKEYGMLQNNLGNTLQYLPSGHPVENSLRACAAYDEALKVRTSKNTPLEYANTISNKANALFNLPDDLEKPEAGNLQNLLQAQAYYQQAWEIFTQHGQLESAELVSEALEEVKNKIS